MARVLKLMVRSETLQRGIDIQKIRRTYRFLILHCHEERKGAPRVNVFSTYIYLKDVPDNAHLHVLTRLWADEKLEDTPRPNSLCPVPENRLRSAPLIFSLLSVVRSQVPPYSPIVTIKEHLEALRTHGKPLLPRAEVAQRPRSSLIFNLAVISKYSHPFCLYYRFSL